MVWRLLKKLRLELPYDPEILNSQYALRKPLIQKDTRTPVFIVTLFTIARTWKQPRCLPTHEWMKKLWYIYIMEYSSAIKGMFLSPESVLVRWMNLEPIIQSEVSQKEKDKYRILTCIYGI